ncbi:hypothetical protein RYX36_000935, partial [Vicia faba]
GICFLEQNLVKGLAKVELVWLKAMKQAPTTTFSLPEGKVMTITHPKDVYFNAIDPPPSRLFALRVLELKEQGLIKEEAMEVADMEYLAEKRQRR